MASPPKPAYEKDGYFLGRSFISSSRLNLNHYLWKDVVGYNIHPAIPVQDSHNLSIADVGTGTGIWLLDVNRQLPSAHLDGFDISADQYPPKEWLPANLSLQTLDIHKPIPEELKGKYDIVHVRLFLAVVRNDDPSPILGNLYSMLKEGGYLQWSEHNPLTMTVESVRPGLETNEIQFLVDRVKEVVPHRWPSLLPESFKSQGFLNVSHEQYPSSPEFRLFFTQMQCILAEEFSFVALDNSGPDKSGPLRRKHIQGATKEMKEGVAINFIPEVTIGQKKGHRMETL